RSDRLPEESERQGVEIAVDRPHERLPVEEERESPVKHVAAHQAGRGLVEPDGARGGRAHANRDAGPSEECEPDESTTSAWPWSPRRSRALGDDAGAAASAAAPFVTTPAGIRRSGRPRCPPRARPGVRPLAPPYSRPSPPSRSRGAARRGTDPGRRARP